MKYWQKIVLAVICVFVMLINYILAKPMVTAIQVSSKQALANRVIVIDPGHGGRDNGAEVDDVKEDVLNLEVANALKHIIEQAGGTVVMIRDDDYDLSSEDASNHKREDLNKRVEIMNRDNVDVFISVHMNKFPQPYVKGGQVFFQVNHSLSKQLAQAVQDRFNDELKANKHPKVGNFFILNETQTPGILVECGFLSNEEERSLLQRSDYQSKIAYAIYQGIVDYLREAIIV